MIPPKRSSRTPPEIIRRRAAYMEKMRRAGEYSLEDVRRCMQKPPTQTTTTECSEVFKHARLRELTSNPLHTLRRYKEEMKACLAHGNRDAHYVEGIKQYFALRNPRKGLHHLRISAKKRSEEGNYILAIIHLVTGEYVKGKRLMGKHNWKKDLAGVDKIWRHVKKSLMAVPIVKRKKYSESLLGLLPPSTCHVTALDDRCTVCFYYKQVAKFIDIVWSG